MKFNLKRQNLTRLKIKETGNYCKKVYFGTQEMADAYIAKLNKTSTREKVPVESYLCHTCNCWHLTSWQSPDIAKFIDDTNAELDAFRADYDYVFEHNMQVMDYMAKLYQDAQIEIANLKVDNFRLQKQLRK